VLLTTLTTCHRPTRMLYPVTILPPRNG
jgi:hypothetical protein